MKLFLTNTRQLFFTPFFIIPTLLSQISHGQNLTEDLFFQEMGIAIQTVETCAQKYPDLQDWAQLWRDSLEGVRVVITDIQRNALAFVLRKNTRVSNFTARKIAPTFDFKNYLDSHKRATQDMLFVSVHEIEKTFTYAQLNHMGLNPIETEPLWESLIHEIFHLARIGNLKAIKHNTYPIKHFRKKRRASRKNDTPLYNPSCSKAQIFNDRVYTISSLCSGLGIFNEESIQTTIAKRIDRCGIRKGCINMWTQKSPFMRKNDPLSQLSEEQATRLCNQIYSEGSSK